jgi:DNA-binding PadR family transcriptional regulator
MHGYQIIQEIAERSNNVWRPSPGSVYPALQLLEDEGLIRAEQSEERKVFQLTDAGRAYVETNRAELDTAWQSVTTSVDDGTLQLRDLLGQVATAVQQVAQVGTPAQLAAAQTLLTNMRRQLYRILADDVPANAE